MASWKDDQGDGRDFEGDGPDRELDAALARYVAVEPRAGLERRILANLRTQQAEVAERGWLRWGVGAALASLIVVAALAWRSGLPSQPVALTHPSAAPQSTQTTATHLAPGAAAQRQATSKRRDSSSRPSQPVMADAPKLDQFPSPQPLSEQELALARYVQSFPGEATLIAQAQEEYEKEIKQEMEGKGPETEGHGSDQQER